MIRAEDKFLGECLAAIEASLNITENFPPIAVILCSLAILFRNVRRALLISLVRSFGFSAEGYLFFTTRSPPYTEYIQGNFTRPFLISIASTMLAAVGLLVVFGVSNIGILLSFYFKRMAAQTAATPSTNRPVDRERVGVATPSNRVTFEDIHIKVMRFLSALFLPVLVIATLIPLYTHILLVSPTQPSSWFEHAFERLFEDLVPQSNARIQDLDQVVATFGGATVLDFSIYGAGKSIYEKRTEGARERERLELIKLQQMRRRR